MHIHTRQRGKYAVNGHTNVKVKTHTLRFFDRNVYEKRFLIMAMNRFMHPRNIYNTPADFGKLAEEFEDFRAITKTVS